jgi:predicted house-cleaning noncanonical NTP pyrophosphatase (MazG superfamily)
MRRTLKMIQYNKLVRDKIPDIISSNGEEPITRILNDEEHKEMLDKKLLEEVKEYLESGEVEELADILEVIRGICTIKKMSFDYVLKLMELKKEKRGGFDNKVFLIEVNNKKSL